MAEEANNNVELSRKRKLDDDDDEVYQPFTKKRKITFDLETNFVLPHEIMIDIMESLDPDDLKKCSEVCKYWLTCSQEIVGWTYVSTVILPHVNIESSYKDKTDKLFHGEKPETKEQDSIPLHVKWHKDTGNWGYEVVSYNNAVVSDSSGQHLFSISSSGVRPKKGAYNDNPEQHLLFDVWEFFANHNGPLTSWRTDTVITRVHYYSSRNGTPIYQYQATLKIYVDAKQFQRALYSGEEFPGVNLIFKYGVKPEVNRMLDKEYGVIAELPKAMFPYLPPKMEPPKGLKEGFKFHRYQVDAISWMKSIENNADKEFKYCDLVPWRASRTSLLFDLHNEKIVLPDKVDEYIGSFKSKGGVLADEVGLGKTVELIGLALTSQDEKLSDFDENGLFNTKASLVICPNHLAMQWSQEVSKYTNLKVSMVTTTEDFRSTTYGDIVNSGFVIMTSQVFKNKNYFTLGCGKKKMSVSIPGMAKRNALVADYLDQIKSSTKLSTVGPIMDHFHFKRIIIDEAHEVFQDAFATLCILPLKKDFGWYVSATPFPSDLLFGPAKKFLEIWKPDYESEETLADEYEEYVENDIIVSNLLWRNTKESIHEEYTVPDYEEELILAEFHPIEAVLHKYGERYENLRLCCGIMYTPTSFDRYNRNAPTSKTFDDLKDWWIADLECAISRMKEKRKHGETSSWYSKEAQAKLEAQKKEVESVPYIVKDKKLKPDEAVYMGRVNQYGTKFAKLIQWISDTIAEDATNRFILFSKREYYVHQVSKRLRSAGIDNVLISGTVVSKSKALKQFREEDVKVMVLSLDRSASGMNLIEANYVVLLDPMDGTVEEARANEIQALGRAHRQGQEQKVTLVRFVIQDSVEEELYLRNKSSGRETLKRTSSTKQLLAKSNSAASLRDILLKSK